MPSQSLLNSPSKLVIRQTLLGRSTSRLRATGPGAFSSRVSSQLPSFASVRRPSGVTLSCGQAGNTPERPGSRVGKRVGLTATVTATWLRRPVGGEPVGTARAVNGLSWTVGQARPGPTDQKVSTAAKYSNDRAV